MTRRFARLVLGLALGLGAFATARAEEFHWADWSGAIDLPDEIAWVAQAEDGDALLDARGAELFSDGQGSSVYAGGDGAVFALDFDIQETDTERVIELVVAAVLALDAGAGPEDALLWIAGEAGARAPDVRRAGDRVSLLWRVPPGRAARARIVWRLPPHTSFDRLELRIGR